MSRIFISYSRKDLATVRGLAREVAYRTGERPWVDLQGVETGTPFSRSIIRGLDECDVVLFVVSKDSLVSCWTEKEVRYAQAKQKKIYPVVIDGSKLDGWFLFEFGNIDCVDYRVAEQREKLFEDLERCVKPVGLRVGKVRLEKEDIFKSARNLGLNLMSALTGRAIEDVQVNRSMVSCGIGCFGWISLNCCDLEEGDTIDDVDDDEGWGLTSSIRYHLYANHLSNDEIYAHFWMLNLNIDPYGLIRGEQENNMPIQFFGPARLLRKLRTGNQRVMESPVTDLDVDNFLEFGDYEPNNAVLLPPKDELDAFYGERSPERKLRMLVDIVTEFASDLSVKLLYAGCVDIQLVSAPTDEAEACSRWFKDGKLDAPWRPTAQEVLTCMKRHNLSLKDLYPEVRKLYETVEERG